ncbi:transposase [Oscillatoriales cyanobacterium LEGE 11467]|uniref:Transposase n=1 Tax=Zarconia navalis LEGE 11467 TaxID=1828826 RepID=A0A928VWP6_9CYAN|nr:transposase [Zarconia navalis]MBE9040127.1 transposase [Zarconia navalis LEGE 11467]
MEVRQLGQWLLDEVRELIHARTSGESQELLENARRRLQQVALMARASEHPKLKALAKEILGDWDAVVAFVENPQLPVTNNHAERALRHAVIARRIGYGTRTEEGTRAYEALLSVMETCRLRGLNPWTYLSEVIAKRRKGMSAPLIPQTRSIATSSPI